MTVALHKHLCVSFHILIIFNSLCLNAWDMERSVGQVEFSTRRTPPRRSMLVPRVFQVNERKEDLDIGFVDESDEDDSTPVGGPDGCERIQIVFLFDGTSSFQRYLDEFKSSMPVVIDRVNKLMPNSEFGLAIFGSWNGARADSCYKSLISLTNDTDEFISELAFMHVSDTENDANALSAIGFAAADAFGLGWDYDSFTGDGQAIHKFIVFMTDSEVHWDLNNEGGRSRWLGNGRDSCMRSYIPHYPDIHKILQATRINIIGLFGSSEVEEEFSEHFMAVGYPFCKQPYLELYFDFQKPFVATVVKCIQEVLQAINHYYGLE